MLRSAEVAARVAADAPSSPAVSLPLIAGPGDLAGPAWAADAASSAATLPWIDAFLRSTPPTPTQAVVAVREAEAVPPQAGGAGHRTPPAAPPVEEARDTVGIASVAAAGEEAAADAPSFERAEYGAPLDVAYLSREEGPVEPFAATAAAAAQGPLETGYADPTATAPAESAADGPDVAMLASTVAESTVAESAEAVEVETGAELWPLDDAAAAFQDLSARLGMATADDRHEALSAPAAPPLAPAAYAPWQDDDFVDVMPMPTGHGLGQAPLTSWGAAAPMEGATKTAAVFTSPGACETCADEARTEDAALALEQVARRMRAGELAMVSYDPRLGEQAALVAALAAVLGVRAR
ncbi:MAG: hypothetical protein ACK5XT_02010 [Gemmatimonas sp.]|uniref:hypothetical protein n=2 Tax=Gemmatimonas sp. TaxID=1962908 RepID=UPI00391F2308|nr:hypothetical protein [Gemmatimonadota bacterium]